MRRFGERLRSLRIRHGLTLKGLADSLGYKTHGYISEIEAGKKAPSVSFLLAVADLFSVSLDDLVRDEVEAAPNNLPEETAELPTPASASGTPFSERPPSEEEIERLRLILSTYQDGSGMLAGEEEATLPGWRDFERSVALAFGGVASENKDIFDVRLPDTQRAGVFFGISCKMRRELARVDRDGRVTIEVSNSAGKFWDGLNAKGIDQSNYKDHPADVGMALINLVSQWHQDASLEEGGNVDLLKSCYLALSWNRMGWYQLHQFPISLPDPGGLTWEYPTYIRNEEIQIGRHLRGSDSEGVIFEWYGESGWQLKYYPLAERALWESSRFRLEPIPAGQEHGVLHKARLYFTRRWGNL